MCIYIYIQYICALENMYKIRVMHSRGIITANWFTFVAKGFMSLGHLRMCGMRQWYSQNITGNMLIPRVKYNFAFILILYSITIWRLIDIKPWLFISCCFCAFKCITWIYCEAVDHKNMWILSVLHWLCEFCSSKQYTPPLQATHMLLITVSYCWQTIMWTTSYVHHALVLRRV